MSKNIKKIGLIAIILGLLCFIIHILLNYHGNSFLFVGIILIFVGTFSYVKGWKG